MASKYMTLRAQRAELSREGEALAERSDLTPTEQARFTELTAQLRAVNSELEVLELERERERYAPGRPVPGMENPHSLTLPEPIRRGPTYAAMFGQPTDAAGWASGEEFFATIHHGLYDARLQPMATAMTRVGSDGGFSVPEPLVARMLDAALEDEVVRPRADVMAMTSNTLKMWGFESISSQSSLFGGFAGAWVAEGDEITVETPKLRTIELAASKLAILTEVSNELLAAGVGYGEQLEGAMVKALSWYLDYFFLSGTGAGQPLGVLNATSRITVAAEVGQPAGSIYFDNVAKMFARLHPACVKNSVWVASPTTIPYLTQLAIVVGVGGVHVPAMTRAGGGFEILTRPVIFTEKVPQLGAEGDLMLVDFSQYAIGLQRDMALDRSQHVGFTRDTAYFRSILLGDGQPKWASAYTMKNGQSLSWCVTLAARE